MADKQLNPGNRYVSFPAVATTGEGVFPTLKALAGLVLESLNRDRRQSGPRTAAPAAAAVPELPAASSETVEPEPVRGPAPAATTRSPAAAAVAETVVEAEPEVEPEAPRKAPSRRRKYRAAEPESRPSSRPAARTRKTRPAPKVQRVVLEEDRGSLMMMGVLLLIILAAAGVILFSFNII
jgi:hypothetical protein